MLTEIPELHRKLLTRAADAHKGTFGTVLVVGGSLGMSGSVTLAGRAALRGGAGLVRVAVPEVILPTVAQACAEYTTVPLAGDERGVLTDAVWGNLQWPRLYRMAYFQFLKSPKDDISQHAELASVVAAGPGMGRGAGVTRVVRRMWTELEKLMILDADGLNTLAEIFHKAKKPLPPGGTRIITPHPGEFERLSGVSAKNREAQCAAAVEFAKTHACVVVLKGAGTLVTDGKQTWRNTTGNPGMATGGSGDVLTGIMAAFAAQLLPQSVTPMDVARLAVYLHGRAGDLAAAEVGQVSLVAGDIIRFLSAALRGDGI